MASRISRRFTTLEGFRRLGDVYVAGSNVRIFSIRHQFDAENYEDERLSWVPPECSHFSNDSSRHTSVDGFAKTRSPSAELDEHFSDALPEPPYHIFSYKEKWAVVVMVGAAGLFSGLSSNIYFPSLDAIAKDLHVSMNAVTQTITTYLIVQGLSPMFWGPLADSVGRRQAYIYSFIVYIVANVGLAFSPNFATLLILRGLQAAGSASTVSIGNGVIQDIIDPAQRGGFVSFYQAIRNMSITVGPVLGGALAKSFGFRSIFIFLLILSVVTLLAIVLFLPETLRAIAGNGSIRLTGINRALIRAVGRGTTQVEIRDHDRARITRRTFLEPLLLLKEKDVLLSLIYGGVVYAVWTMVTSSTTGLFKANFGLNELMLGLAFLPNGLGTIVGSTVIGNLMNRSYTKAEAAYKEQHSLPSNYSLPKKHLPPDFPIERTRLAHMMWISVLFIFSTMLYGFSLASRSLVSKRGWIAIPLSFQFLIAATSNAVFAVNQTMVSDLYPGKGASSTAINNLVRCSMGAVGVAFVEELIARLGSGGAFLGLALITLTVAPVAMVQWYWGAEWRRQRTEALQSKDNGC